MKRKCRILSFALLISAVVVFIIAYVFYHYLTPEGLVSVWQPKPAKPYVTFLVSMLGILLLLSSIKTFFVSSIFFGKEDKVQEN